ncbi:hypothetical protein E2553_02390 [Paraburkholderia dipogonis]|uniref:Uncharacterized protein n=1 Tax=Paraburkholderia dipogonis TaxID=1211383 RepID=A0A4Y8N3D7_9BURK|nr:hypothetical protein E2553_02390 [Paraburkholderia dipogonis]
MSCAARYSETTSLEFILNPFKFFFTNYVAKIAPYSPPNIPHLETKFRPPTILRSYRSNCGYTLLPFYLPRSLVSTLLQCCSMLIEVSRITP